MGCVSGSEQKQQTTSYIKPQKTWLKEGLNLYGPWLGKGQVSYEGERLAPMDEGQLEAIRAATGYIPELVSGGEMPLYRETGGTLSKLLAGKLGAQPITPEQRDIYYENVMRKPTERTWERDIKPAIGEAFAGPGYYGGPRMKQTAETSRDIFENLESQYADLNWKSMMYNKGLEETKAGRAQGAIPQALAYGAAPLQQAQAKLSSLAQIYGFAEKTQAQRQAEIQVAMEKFTEGQRLTDPEKLSILMAMITTPMQSSYGSSSGPGLGYSAVGALASGFGGGFGAQMGKNWATQKATENLAIA